jgi:hypothetical protein
MTEQCLTHLDGFRCIYVAGHGGDHNAPQDGADHSDEIRIRVLQDRLEIAKKLQDLTLTNEVRWMRKHEELLNLVASLRDWKSPDGVLQVKDLQWFKDLKVQA